MTGVAIFFSFVMSVLSVFDVGYLLNDFFSWEHLQVTFLCLAFRDKLTIEISRDKCVV